MKQKTVFTEFSSRYGKIKLIWKKSDHPKIQRIFLPNSIKETVFIERYGEAEFISHPAVETICADIIRFLNGEDIKFNLQAIDLGICDEFQRSVLLAEYHIPRGWISTYGRIAKTLDKPKGARAVGWALSNNPFPIIIPCHRAILSNGGLGGFQGGVEMKMDLLKKEGVEFSSTCRVVTNRIYY